MSSRGFNLTAFWSRFVVYCHVLGRTSLARLLDAEYTQAVRQRVGNYKKWWYLVDAAEKLAGESISRVSEDKLAAREKPIISGTSRAELRTAGLARGVRVPQLPLYQVTYARKLSRPRVEYENGAWATDSNPPTTCEALACCRLVESRGLA